MPHSFALYLEIFVPAEVTEDAASPNSADWQRRTQVVLLPGRRGDGGDGALHVVTRTQTRPGHRAIWRHGSLSEQADVRSLLTWYPVAGSLRPPIVVQLTTTEATDYVSREQTPYKAIERAKRVAKKHHGFTI